MGDSQKTLLLNQRPRIFLGFLLFCLTSVIVYKIIHEKLKKDGFMINLVGQIDTYERGLMSDEEMVDFFQTLIDSGTIDHMQGHYGRVAASLIEEGLCNAS